MLTASDKLKLKEFKLDILRLITDNQSQVYPLSHSQMPLWYAYCKSPQSSAYNVGFSVRCSVSLCANLLKDAMAILLERHELLRSNIVKKDEAPYLCIQQKKSILINEDNVASMSLENISELVQSYYEKPFSLENDDLIRVNLLHTKDNGSILLVTIPHIICDGWSLWNITDELSKIYESLYQAKQFSPVSNNLTYSDFVKTQAKFLSGPDFSEQLDYWQEKYSTSVETLGLPGSNRSSIQNWQTLQFNLDTECLKEVVSFANATKVSLSSFFLAIYTLLLYRYTSNQNIIIGVPFLGRNLDDYTNTLGCFINLIGLRLSVDINKSFAELLEHAHAELQGANNNQDIPFYLLNNHIKNLQNIDGLISTSFNYLRAPSASSVDKLFNYSENQTMYFGGHEVKPFALTQQNGQFDLNIVLLETKSGIQFSLKYNAEIYNESLINGIRTSFNDLIKSSIKEINLPVKKILCASAAKEKAIIDSWNLTTSKYDSSKCIHQLFEEQVLKTPHNIAFIHGDEEITYHELNQLSNQIANFLLAAQLGNGSRIGVSLDRSLNMVAYILGILKAGMTYIPLDKAYPKARLDYIIENCDLDAVVGTSDFAFNKDFMFIDINAISSLINKQSAANLNLSTATAYAIYTSGSTGNPKGVTVSHKNLTNFSYAMQKKLGNENKLSNFQNTWLAVTNVSFDISILELLWTIANGYKVVIQDDTKNLGLVSNDSESSANIDFSLFYFSAQHDSNSQQKYNLLLKGATYADENEFKAVWVPERHFHEFGGNFPNPSILASALSMVTKNIHLRSGSIVLPLHNPIRVVEDWSTIDNLSNGRVGLSFASGWNPNDFAISPHNYADRRKVLYESIDTVKKLWSGDKVNFKNGVGKNIDIETFPTPLQKSLPIWLTAASDPETFKQAGEQGLNLLTHLLGQTLESLQSKIAIYHDALLANGFDPKDKTVTLMLHTFVYKSDTQAYEIIAKPFRDYLKTSLGLLKNLITEENLPQDVSDAELVEIGFNKYIKSSALFGSPETCLSLVNKVKSIGVNEIACLIDFGVDDNLTLEALPYLNRLKCLANTQEKSKLSHVKYNTPAQNIIQHKVTHLQCTPAYLQMILAEKHGSKAIRQLQTLLVGGDSLNSDLGRHASSLVKGNVYNMYGPTETTIWSTICKVTDTYQCNNIGTPIANTKLLVLDKDLSLTPIGMKGELYIGGDGVTPGYFNNYQLTAEKFIQSPFGSEKLYKTGDIVKYRDDGALTFIGRLDNQVKFRGYRIDLGDIESSLLKHNSISSAVVLKKEMSRNNHVLAAYLLKSQHISIDEVRYFLSTLLPEYMIPTEYIFVESYPLTLNGKVDRSKLLTLQPEKIGIEVALALSNVEIDVLRMVRSILRNDNIFISDNFFDLGGNSIAAVKLISRIDKDCDVHLSTHQIFNAKNIREIAKEVESSLSLSEFETIDI